MVWLWSFSDYLHIQLGLINSIKGYIKIPLIHWIWLTLPNLLALYDGACYNDLIAGKIASRTTFLINPAKASSNQIIQIKILEKKKKNNCN